MEESEAKTDSGQTARKVDTVLGGLAFSIFFVLPSLDN
jgi:hypothetical protein